MDLGSKIRLNTLWVFTGNTSTQVINFFVGILLARILNPEDFGTLTAIQVFTGVAGFLSGAGMGQAIIQSKDVDRRAYDVVFTLQLIIGFIIYTFFFFLSSWLSEWYNNKIYEDLLKVSALTFIIRPFTSVSRSILQRNLKFKPIVLINFCSLLIRNGISIFLAYKGFKVWSLIIGGLYGAAITATLLLITTKYFPLIHFNIEIAKNLGKYGFKASLDDFISYIRDQTPNFLIGKFLNNNILGIFNKGYSLSGYPFSMVAGSAYQTVFRVLSSKQDNLDQSKYIYLRTITLVSVYSFPFYVALFWLSEPFIVTIYGEKWRLASIPLQLFSISRLFACIGNPGGAVMAAQNLLNKEILIKLFSLGLSSVGCLYGIYENDIKTLTLALIPSSFFTHFMITYFSMQAIKVTFRELFNALLPTLILNTALAIFIYSSDQILKITTPQLSHTAYLLIISGSSGLFYIMFFLFFPIKSLETEQNRWKKYIIRKTGDL